MNNIYQTLPVKKWQDKAPRPASPAASPEPETAISLPGDRELNTDVPRSPADTPAVYRPARHGTERRQTEHVSGRIPTALRIELDHIAKENNWSESYAVRVAIQKFIENTIEQSMGRRVEAIVTSAIERTMQKRENREAKLLARIYRTLEEFRVYIDKVLAFFPQSGERAAYPPAGGQKRRAGHALPHVRERRRVAVVVANYIRPGKTARAKAKATILYNAERVGREKEEISRILFGWQGPITREEAELLIDRAATGTVFFRVMINFDPVKEDPDKLLNIWEIVRKTYEQIEHALGLEGKIQFIAALHDDHTNLRHIHSLMLVPHRLSKEQFWALAVVPRATATEEALRQRRVLDLRQRQALDPHPRRAFDLSSDPPERRVQPVLSRTLPHQPAGSVGGRTRRVQSHTYGSGVHVTVPPSCPRDEALMKRTKQGYRCPQCGYRQEQELSL